MMELKSTSIVEGRIIFLDKSMFEYFVNKDLFNVNAFMFSSNSLDSYPTEGGYFCISEMIDFDTFIEFKKYLQEFNVTIGEKSQQVTCDYNTFKALWNDFTNPSTLENKAYKYCNDVKVKNLVTPKSPEVKALKNINLTPSKNSTILVKLVDAVLGCIKAIKGGFYYKKNG